MANKFMTVIIITMRASDRTSLVAQTVKRLSTMRETRVWALGWEDSLEKEMTIHSSTLAWKIPWTEEPGRLQSMGSQRVGHDWATSVSSLSWGLVVYCLLSHILLLLTRFSRVRLCATHRRQPTRLPCPWDSPGKNTGVGCHFLLQCVKVQREREVAQSCPTLRDRMDCSLPGSSVHWIFQARVLEWGAIAFSESYFRG